jgi:tRNA dimethylallyltransferase
MRTPLISAATLMCLLLMMRTVVGQQATPPPYRILRIGLTRSREELYARIDQRIDAMLQRGLLEEVRGLMDAGYTPQLPALTGLGYRQMIHYLQGELSFEEAVAAIKHQTRRFVHQQNTWFREGDERIVWFDLGRAGYEDIAEAVRAWAEQ